MTKKETVQLLAILKAAYPSSYRNMTAEDTAGTVSVWELQFSDTPAEVVLVAVQKLISTSKFPPTISEVKEKIGSLYYQAICDIQIQKTVGLEPSPVLQRIAEAAERFRNSDCPPEPGSDRILNLPPPQNVGSLELEAIHRMMKNTDGHPDP